jgi:hypothetical protein
MQMTEAEITAAYDKFRAWMKAERDITSFTPLEAFRAGVHAAQLAAPVAEQVYEPGCYTPRPAPVAAQEPTYLSAMTVADAIEGAQRWADKVDPFTRKEAPDHLTAMCAAQALRLLASQPAQGELVAGMEHAAAICDALAEDRPEHKGPLLGAAAVIRNRIAEPPAQGERIQCHSVYLYPSSTAPNDA